ncbi:MAG: alpha/beta fold hydrolase [Anaerolineaceae bacterium]|nr:alpha/beta fold hydrolase [Anaerolineaceae bacterium]
MPTDKKASPMDLVATGVGAFTATTLLAAGGWIVYSNLLIDHNMSLPEAIPADRQIFFSKTAGRLSYYVDRQASGRPLVLIHSVNAAASAYEMRPLFDHYRFKRPVFALDLPGYGFSERSPRVYTPKFFEDAIMDLLVSQVGGSADVVALSLGCEFAARAAVNEPGLFHSLTLISPTGLGQRNSQTRPYWRASQQSGKRVNNERIYPILSFPIWGRALFDLIASRASIRYFLQKSFNGPIAPGFVDYAYATSHQPGAENVPLYFISGKLFTPDISGRVYENLKMPVQVLYDRDGFTHFDRLAAVLEKNPLWKATRIKHTLGLPHFEKLAETVEAMDGLWRSQENAGHG